MVYINMMLVKRLFGLAEKICNDLNVHHTSALHNTLIKTQKEIPARIWLSDDEIAKRTFVANIAFSMGKIRTNQHAIPTSTAPSYKGPPHIRSAWS